MLSSAPWRTSLLGRFLSEESEGGVSPCSCPCHICEPEPRLCIYRFPTPLFPSWAWAVSSHFPLPFPPIGAFGGVTAMGCPCPQLSPRVIGCSLCAGTEAAEIKTWLHPGVTSNSTPGLPTLWDTEGYRGHPLPPYCPVLSF